MTGAVIGLGAGIGLLLILLGLMAPRAQRQARTSWLRRTIDRAGLERVGPSAIVGACVALAAVSGLLVVVISGVLILGLLAAVVFG